MEHKDPEFESMQADLQSLRQNISEHTALDVEQLRRAVKRHMSTWRVVTMGSALILVVGMTAGMLFLYREGLFPLWFSLVGTAFFWMIAIMTVVEQARLRRSDLRSHTGLLTLKESLQVNRKHWYVRTVQVAGGLLLVGMLLFILFREGTGALVRQVINLIITGLICAPLFKWMRKKSKKTQKNIDVLLEEEGRE